MVLISGAGVKKGHFISQGGTVITKKGNFYHKLGQELQGKVIITKYGSTKLKCEKWWREIYFAKRLLDSQMISTEFAPRNFWRVQILLESKEGRNNTPTTGISAWLVHVRSNYWEAFLVLKTIFRKLLQNLYEITHYGEWWQQDSNFLRRVSKDTQILLTHFTVTIFVLEFNIFF